MYVTPNIELVTQQVDSYVDAIEAGFVETKNQTILTVKILGYMAKTWFTSDDEQEKKEVAE
mgnify:FL=1